MSRIDVLIFGASGFTGKYTVREMFDIAGKFGERFTWGVAGRSKEKLRSVLEEEAKRANADTSDVAIVVADVRDEASLDEMAKRAKVIVNCCGPFRFLGEAVVKACIANKTHHVDVSGEPQYMETIQLKYDREAREKEVYVVSACGVCSIPADLGVVFLKNKFDGVVNSADIYFDAWSANNATKVSGLHYGTWQSAVHSLAHYSELAPLRRALFPTRMPDFQPRKNLSFLPHKNKSLKKWCLPFPESDRSVVRRSQRIFFEMEKQRPIQVNSYVAVSNMFAALALILFGAIFSVMTQFEMGRKMLLKHPKVFSFGMASREGPTEEESDNTHFSFTFFAEGWKEKLEEPSDQYSTPPDKKLVTRVTGKNPGYGATCVALVLSALTVLTEADKMPDKGGVFPPGAAFAKTNLIDNLNKFGVAFEVVEEEASATPAAAATAEAEGEKQPLL